MHKVGVNQGSVFLCIANGRLIIHVKNVYTFVPGIGLARVMELYLNEVFFRCVKTAFGVNAVVGVTLKSSQFHSKTVFHSYA